MDNMIVTLFGGPKHNKKYKINADVGFLKFQAGHYACVQGGLPDEFYWHNFTPPIAIDNVIVEKMVTKVN